MAAFPENLSISTDGELEANCIKQKDPDLDGLDPGPSLIAKVNVNHLTTSLKFCWYGTGGQCGRTREAEMEKRNVKRG